MTTLLDDSEVLQWYDRALSTIVKLNNIVGFLPINIEEILQAVVNEVFDLFSDNFSSFWCTIHLIDEKDNLKLACYRTTEKKIEKIHIVPNKSSCIVLRDGLPYISTQSSYCTNRFNNSFHICIPIMTAKEDIGILSLTMDRPVELTNMHLNVLLAISNLTSTAIQRNRLYDNLKREKQEIEQAYQRIDKLNQQLQQKIKELKETQQKLLQSEKLALVGKLIAGISHEINNPIGIILNRIECVLYEADEKGLDPMLKEDLSVIYKQASRISSLVKDMLLFSAKRSELLTPVKIMDIINRTLLVVMETMKKEGINLIVNSDCEGIVESDPDRLEQVFLNLINNAIDAMPQGGNIILDVRDKSDDYIEIMIKDEGIGINREDLPRVFEPFFTTKKPGKGTGLGLSICYEIIKSHGGNITVKSEEGKGTVFSIVLPRYRE